MASRAPWYAAGVTSLLAAIASGVGGYYASGAGSSADKIAANEHRMTQIEDEIKSHEREDDRGGASYQIAFDKIDRQFRNVWCAIRVNHGEPCQP